MRIHIVDGGGPTAIGAALEASPFSPGLQAAMWKELLDGARFPICAEGLFNCAHVTTLGAGDQISGGGEDDLVAHLGLGSAGEVLAAALWALALKPAVEHMAHAQALTA